MHTHVFVNMSVTDNIHIILRGKDIAFTETSKLLPGRMQAHEGILIRRDDLHDALEYLNLTLVKEPYLNGGQLIAETSPYGNLKNSQEVFYEDLPSAEIRECMDTVLKTYARLLNIQIHVHGSGQGTSYVETTGRRRQLHIYFFATTDRSEKLADRVSSIFGEGLTPEQMHRVAMPIKLAGYHAIIDDNTHVASWRYDGANHSGVIWIHNRLDCVVNANIEPILGRILQEYANAIKPKTPTSSAQVSTALAKPAPLPRLSPRLRLMLFAQRLRDFTSPESNRIGRLQRLMGLCDLFLPLTPQDSAYRALVKQARKRAETALASARESACSQAIVPGDSLRDSLARRIFRQIAQESVELTGFAVNAPEPTTPEYAELDRPLLSSEPPLPDPAATEAEEQPTHLTAQT